MVGQPLQLQRNAAQRLGPRRHRTSGKHFDGLAISRGMADRSVAGQGLHVVDRPLVGATDERPLDAAMLVTE